MGRVQSSTRVAGLNNINDLSKFVEICLDDIVNQLNGNVEFLKNMKLKTLSVAFTSANSDTTAIHGLGFVPNGYITYGLTASMTVYDGSAAWTSSTITLRSSAVGTARLMVF